MLDSNPSLCPNHWCQRELAERVPEKQWTEIHNIVVQETVTKIIPKEKKSRKAKWLSEEALQIAEERRDVKGKGEREKYL